MVAALLTIWRKTSMCTLHMKTVNCNFFSGTFLSVWDPNLLFTFSTFSLLRFFWFLERLRTYFLSWFPMTISQAPLFAWKQELSTIVVSISPFLLLQVRLMFSTCFLIFLSLILFGNQIRFLKFHFLSILDIFQILVSLLDIKQALAVYFKGILMIKFFHFQKFLILFFKIDIEKNLLLVEVGTFQYFQDYHFIMFLQHLKNHLAAQG